jgi:hypothetical protein
VLQIKITSNEGWDELNQVFTPGVDTVLILEHSLISISKWESKWHVPFLTKDKKTSEQIIDYIKCMTVTPNVKPEVYNFLTKSNIDEVMRYIDDPMTASTVKQIGGTRRSREIITSELIYYWMVALQIPFECQKWHINRLMMLIQICNVKNQPDKKMSKRNTMQQNAALNAARRQRMHSKG